MFNILDKFKMIRCTYNLFNSYMTHFNLIELFKLNITFVHIVLLNKYPHGVGKAILSCKKNSFNQYFNNANNFKLLQTNYL